MTSSLFDMIYLWRVKPGLNFPMGYDITLFFILMKRFLTRLLICKSSINVHNVSGIVWHVVLTLNKGALIKLTLEAGCVWSRGRLESSIMHNPTVQYASSLSKVCVTCYRSFHLWSIQSSKVLNAVLIKWPFQTELRQANFAFWPGDFSVITCLPWISWLRTALEFTNC